MLLQKKVEKFFQIFIFDENIILRKIENGTIEFVTIYNIKDANNMFLYIAENRELPLEIVISNSDSLVKSIFKNKNIKNTDIKKILQNNGFNTSFYLNKDNISVCNTNLNKEVINILDKLFIVNNIISSISCWPIWIIYNYFSFFISDIDRFKLSIFVVQYNGISEIIAVDSKINFICYRRFITDYFDQNNEVSSTLQYVSSMQKVDAKDIAVYMIDEKTICTFTKPVPITMKFVSEVIKEKKFFLDRHNHSIKIAIKMVCCLIIAVTGWQILEVVSVKRMLTEANKVNKSVSEHVIKEKKNWESIDDSLIQPIDFKTIIEKIIKNTGIGPVSNIEITALNKNISLSMETLEEIEDKDYSKEIVYEGYKFNISVSEEGKIVCNGESY